MPTVAEYKKCKQCSYEFGEHEFNCHSSEWEFECLRCGFAESQQWITAADKTRIGWKHEIRDGYGAVWSTSRTHRETTSSGLHSPQEVQQAVQKMQTGIARRELDPCSSYVTRWNPEFKRAELVAGTWCLKGEVFGFQSFDMARFPVDVLKPEEE